MRFPSLVVALASVAAGFDMPENAPYGEYLIPISSNGTQTGEAVFIRPIDESVFAAKGNAKDSIQARNWLPYSSINCSWRQISRAAFDGVRSQVAEWCDAGGHVPPNTAWYWYSSSGEGYMCNYSGNAQGCSQPEYDDALDLIKGVCGEYIAGWVGINDWAKSYGIDNNGAPQCW